MAIIVNNPSGESDGSIAFAIGLIVLVAAIALFIIYGWPALRGTPAPQEPNTTNIEVEVPNPVPPAPGGNEGVINTN